MFLQQVFAFPLFLLFIIQWQFSRNLIFAQSNNTTTNGFPDGTFPKQISIERYQIVLWTSIMLVLTLLAAIWGLLTMKFKKDTMLYSTFNPAWEDRKRR